MTRRLAWGTAWAGAALGGMLWVLPPVVRVAPSLPLALDSSGTIPAPAVNPSVAEEIAMANVFASSRTPPPSRYTPAELAGDSANGMMDAPGSPPMMPSMSPLPGEAAAGDVPRLFGTVVGPLGAQALLQLDPLIPSPRSYGVGEGDGGYRVMSISARAVVVRGPGGRVTLRLADEGGNR